jgi:predicted Zn-dependent peptidase
LGRPILGTKETVRRFHQQALFDYYGARFVPGNMVISAAGSLNHDRFVELMTRTFEHLEPRGGMPPEAPPSPQARIMLRNKKSLEQVQICIGVPSYSISHENRYASFVLNTLLGGGMSSRLFQNIREQQGLVYSIFSELNPYRDTGCLAVYAGTSRHSAGKVVNSIINEFRELKTNLVSPDELERAKNQLKGSLMLSMESSTARMSNLARQEMYYNRFFGMNDIIERVQAVSAEDVRQNASEFFRSDQIAVTVLGNLTGLKIAREQLVC